MDNTTLESCIDKFLVMCEQDKQLLINCTQEQSYKKGEAILKEGEICQAFFLVAKGYLRSYYDKDGVQINVNFTFEGNFTANLKSYRNRTPSEMVIEAAEDTTVWIFNFRILFNQLNDHPEIARFVRRLAISLLLASEEHSDLFKIYTPTERYRFIEKNNPQLLQRVSLSQIASYLGVTRETLSRIRAKNV
jgi:CRP-like cAMP-binding protein